MVKGCSNSAIQCVLFTFNFIFLGLGAAICGIGAFLTVRSKDFNQIMETPDEGAIILVIVGALIFLLSFLGCCGAIRESSCILRMYCLVVGSLALILIVPVIVFIIYNLKIDQLIDKEMKKAFLEYRISDPRRKQISSNIDAVQESFQCCGFEGPDWWSKNVPDFQDSSVPLSCCRTVDPGQNLGKCPISQTRFDKGCKEQLDETLKFSLRILLGLLLIVGVTLLIAACFACVLANAV